MQRAGRRRRVDAQLVGQRDAQPLVGRERPRRLTGELVRGEEEAPGRLIDRVGIDGRLRGHPAERRVACLQRGGRGQVTCVAEEPRAAGPGLLHPVGVRLALEERAGAEHLQGSGRGRRGGPRCRRGQQPSGLLDQPRRLVEVDLDRRRRSQPVALSSTEDYLRAQGGTQPADQRRNVLGGAGRRTVTPKRLDDPIGWHRVCPLHSQQHQQSPRPTGDRRRSAVADHLERTGHPHGDSAHRARLRARWPPMSSTVRACAQ